MKESPERIQELPGKQLTVTFDQDISNGGLVGLRIITEGTINLTLIHDSAAGVVFPVSPGDVIVARIKQVNSGGTLTASDVIGLA